MSVNITAILSQALTAAGLPVGGVSIASSGGDANATFTLLFDGVTTVRLDWTQAPTGPQVTQADAIVLANSNMLTLSQQDQTSILYAQTIAMRAAAFLPQDYDDFLAIMLFNGPSPPGLQSLPNRYNYCLQAFQYTGVVTGALEAAVNAINGSPS